MGGSNNVSFERAYVAPPTERDVRKEKDKERKDAVRGRRSAAAQRAGSTSNLSSQSRRTGFSGSGIYIPGAE